MAQRLDIFVTGIGKPLSEWSDRALEQLRADVHAQFVAFGGPRGASDELVRNGQAYAAEKKRRAGELTTAEVDELKSRGFCERSFGGISEQPSLGADNKRELGVDRDRPALEDKRERDRGVEL